MLNMSRVKSLLFLLLIVFPCAVLGQGRKQIIGYYPGWKWYDRSGLVKPSTIRYDRYTIINYAFLNPTADGRLACMDPWAEKNLLLGDIDWTLAPAGYETDNDLGNPAYHRRGSSLVAHAHAAGVKVMLSIGGWTQSSLFPGIAAEAAKRAVFAHWCAEAMRRYDADGVDIDWEGPGYAPHNGSPADKANFTLLLRAIRDSLDAHGIRAERPMLLSAAVGADAESMRNIDWAPVSALLDYVNLMTYEFAGTWNAVTNHLAPLHRPAQGDTALNVHSTVCRLIDAYGVPPSKIVLGIPFYGRSLKTAGAPGLHAPMTGAQDAVTFPAYGGDPQYFDIQSAWSLFEDRWDSVAQAPYLIGKNGLLTFVSYDNPRSVALKARYALDNNLGGAMIWEITGDYAETAPASGVIAGTPLADTLASVLRATTVGLESIDHRRHSNNGAAGAFGIATVFPNPVRRQGSIAFTLQQPGRVELDIVTARGERVRTLLRDDRLAGVHDAVWDGLDDAGRALANGTYFFRLRSGGREDRARVLLLR